MINCLFLLPPEYHQAAGIIMMPSAVVSGSVTRTRQPAGLQVAEKPKKPKKPVD
jgi:hypothetical protein